VSAILDSAVEQVSNVLGAAITPVEIQDWYEKSCRVFSLSQPGVMTVGSMDPTPIATLSYFSNAQPPARTLVAADRYWRDPTLGRIEYRLNDDYQPDVTPLYQYPWVVTYTNDISRIKDDNAVGSIKMAVRVLVTRLWQHRGRIDPNPHATDKAISSILAPAKSQNWYLTNQGINDVN